MLNQHVRIEMAGKKTQHPPTQPFNSPSLSFSIPFFLSRCHLSTVVLRCPSGESRVSVFFPSGPQLPPPCIFNGHTRAMDKWFLFLTGEGGLLLHRDEESVSNHAPRQEHTHTVDTIERESQKLSSYVVCEKQIFPKVQVSLDRFLSHIV